MDSSIYIPIIIVASSGLFFAFLIAIVAHICRVDENPKISQIMNVLPGANCGACGKAGCAAYATAIVTEHSEISLCAPGGSNVIAKIAEITGQSAVAATKRTARIMCKGGITARDEYDYIGVKTCSANNLTLKGLKFCKFGCLGFGDCVTSCKFNALTINEQGLPEVNEEVCVACGACVKACPKNLIELHEMKRVVFVQCKSQDKGAIVRKICAHGCIGCGLCVKECPFNAIAIQNNLAVIDYEKCKQCGKCVKVCPQNTITNFRIIKKQTQ